MEAFVLGSIVLAVLLFLIYSSLKTKKIYSENLEYEPKNEDFMKKIEKRLMLKGYKFKTIHKYEYYYKLNDTKDKVLLPRIRVYTKGLKKSGLIINNDTDSLKDNLTLKKQVMEFINSGILKQIIVFNEKSGSMEIIKKRVNMKKRLLIIFFIIVFFLVFILWNYKLTII